MDLLFGVRCQSRFQLFLCKTGLDQQRKVVIFHVLTIAEFFEAANLLFEALIKLCDPFLELAVEIVNHLGAIGPQLRLHVFHRLLEILVRHAVRKLFLDLGQRFVGGLRVAGQVVAALADELSGFHEAVKAVPHVAHWLTLLMDEGHVHVNALLDQVFCDLNCPREAVFCSVAVLGEQLFVGQRVGKDIEHFSNFQLLWS